MLTLIREGDMSTAVFKLQQGLKENGFAVTADGKFGQGTTRAVADYQRRRGLVPDGIVGPATIRALGLDLTPAKMTDRDIETRAASINVDPAMIKAFVRVEAPNGGFDSQGRPTILYERHYFHRLFVVPRKPGDTVQSLTNERQRIMDSGNRDICWPRALTGAKTDSAGRAIPEYDRYGPNSLQYPRLERARAFSDTAALMSASWGAFQVMGENGVAFGWSSVQAFHRAMQASEVDHLDSFIAYAMGRRGAIVKGGPVYSLIDALRSKNFDVIAGLYNGPAQIKVYGPKLREEWNKFK